VGGAGCVRGAVPPRGAPLSPRAQRVRDRLLHVPGRARARPGAHARARPRRDRDLALEHPHAVRARHRAAAWLYAEHAPHGVRFLPFALFMGASLSITAFPVLARILIERDLLKTKVGAVTIVCAAVDDVTAWCLLAFVVAVVGTADLA